MSVEQLTSLFLQGPRLLDAAERVESFVCEALALFVLQWSHIWQLQRTENREDLSKRRNQT